MKKIVFYSVASTIIWYAGQALGAGFGVSVLASLMGPPALLMSRDLAAGSASVPVSI